MVHDRVSQRDLAAQLNLSVATVSRSLRNDKSIHPATRARVQELAIRRGYRLPGGRNALRPEGLRTLMVILGPPSGPSRAGDLILAGISEAGAADEVQIAIHAAGEQLVEALAEPDNWPAPLKAGLAAGILLVHRLPDDVVARLTSRLPTVSIIHHYPDLPIDCIDTDQVEATAQMVEKLAGCGHRQIGFMGRGRGMRRERRRLCGYREGLHRVGMHFQDERALNVSDPVFEPDQLIDELSVQVRAGVRAWVCASDGVVFDLHRRLRDRAPEVADAIRLTGYGGLAAPHDAPPIATVKVPYRDLGAAALRRLLRRLDDPTSPLRDVLLRHEVVGGCDIIL